MEEADLVRDAIHLVSGDGPAGTLMQAGLRVRPDPDTLTVGPSHPDPRRHNRMRRRFWIRELQLPRWKWCEAENPELSPQRPWPRQGAVVVWTSARISERLFSWRAIDRLADSNVELWRAEPVHPEYFIEALAELPPQFVLTSLARASRMSAAEIARARRSWRSFAGGNLSLLDRLVRNEPPMRGWLRNMLPRMGAEGLRISRLDETLLRPFERWKTPFEAMKARDAWRDVVLTYGDHFMLTRLWKWTLGVQPALFAKPGHGLRPWAWGAAALQLTPAGVRMLRVLRPSDEPPPMWVGGHEVHGADSWFVTRSGALRRVSGG
ncbi:MAG: hypothetical protein ACXWLM_05705 [Myxococcales bacterium]